MQKAENVQAMIDADDDDIAAPRQIGAVGHRPIARTIGEGTAVQPHHDRPLAVAKSGCPHIQGQAVLALGCGVRRPKQSFEHGAPLGAIGQLPRAAGIGERVPHPGPGKRRLGRFETVVSRCRDTIRHGLERIDAEILRAAQLACSDFDDRRFRAGDFVCHAMPSLPSP
jgi:hypothetical protein